MQLGHLQAIAKQGRQRREQRAGSAADIGYCVVAREYLRAIGVGRRRRQDRLLQRLRRTAIGALRV